MRIQKSVGSLLGALAFAACSVSQAQVTNFVVDSFDPAGVGTNIYSSGMITNVWSVWFGSAVQSITWDANSDASNNPSSGSMKISANFGDQLVVFNGFGTFTPAVNGFQYTNFECDVRFDPSSATTVNGGTTNFGHLEFGTDTKPSDGQDYFGGLEIPVSNTNWVHVSLPIKAISDPNFTNIQDVVVHIYGPWYSNFPLTGPSILWVDNIKFVGTTNIAQIYHPTLSQLQPAVRGLRFIAGDTSQTYMRENIASQNQYASWYGNGGPFSYTITITNFPAKAYSGFEYHMFLIPTAALTYGPYDNSFADYDASDLMSFRIICNVSNYVGTLDYKVGLPGANPNQPLAVITNATALGTWTVAFNDDLTGNMGIGTNTASFAIPPADAAHFANPLVAYFGVQAQATNNIGQTVDVTQIGFGPFTPDNFASDVALDTTGTWTIVASITNSIVLAGPGSKYWVNWTIPDVGFNMIVSTNVNSAAGWRDPAVYNGNTPIMTTLVDTKRWALILSNNIPPYKNVFFGLRAPFGN
jgi:hypothetical protein